MADKKISALTASTTPLAGTEVLPIVQSGATVKVSVADLTAGRAIASTSIATNVVYTSALASSPASSAQSFYIYSGGGLSANAGLEWQYATSGAGYGFKVNVSGGADAWEVGYRANSASWTRAFAVGNNGNATIDTGNLVIGTNGKGIVTNTAGQITQDAFSAFTSGVAKVISPAKSSGFMVFVTGYSLSGGYSAILNYGDAITVVNEQNTTGGTVAFTSVSNRLNVTTTGSASQILQELWVSVIGK